MDKKYIMIIENNAVISTALPRPLECPRCNKPYWVIWGAGDVVTVSNECKCTDQTPKIEKGVAELKQQGKDILDANLTEPDAAEPDAAEPDAAEPKPSVW